MFRLAALIAVLCAAAPVGTRAADPGADAAKTYRVVTEGSTRELRSGGQGKIVLFIEPLAKVHVHPQAPLKIALEATAGLKLAKAALGHSDAVDPQAEAPRFEVPFVAEARGKQEAKARLDFFICSDQWCVKQVKDVVIAVDVK
jgi:hypothetical protein